MATHTTFLSLIKAQRNRFDQVITSGDACMREMAYEGWRDHLKLTGGGIKQKTLDAMGNPYGRGPSAAANFLNAGNVGRRGANKKHGKMAAPLLPINEQSAAGLRSTIRPVGFRKGVYDVHIGGGLRYARFILNPAGTKEMVGRGMMGWRELKKSNPIGMVERLHRTRSRVLRDALKRAGRKN